MSSTSHWTERSTEDFLYSIASDFMEDLAARMRKIPGMNRSKLAKAAKVNKSYVSRIFKDPGNLSLETMIKFARVLDMKVSVLAYEDTSDPDNERGPVSAEVFRLCWEQMNRPADMWAFKEAQSSRNALNFTPPISPTFCWYSYKYQGKPSALETLDTGKEPNQFSRLPRRVKVVSPALGETPLIPIKGGSISQYSELTQINAASRRINK